MKREDKELLLKDLCARLSNWKWNDCVKFKEGGVLFGIKGTTVLIQSGSNGDMISEYDVEEIHPYLRSLTTLTSQECQELSSLQESAAFKLLNPGYGGLYSNYLPDLIDFVHSHHFDYRGLIEKGLAIVAPDGMYKL